MSPSDTTPQDDTACRRKLASAANNLAWTLSEQAQRTPEQDQEMLEAAWAALYLWRAMGGPQQRALGHLLLGQVHALLDRGRDALVHARQAFEQLSQPDHEPWELALSHAVLAHAAHAAGDAALHASHHAVAEQLTAALADPQDREIVQATLHTVPRPTVAPGPVEGSDRSLGSAAPGAAACTRQGVVIFAKDKKRMSAFYRRTLDLQVFEESASADVLRGHGLEVVVHRIPQRIAADIVISQPPVVREETPIKPTFVVASLAAVRSAADETGGFLKPLARAWHFRGATVLDGHDPEGNVVQFKQLDAPAP